MSFVDWACESCTFINSELLPKCEMCGALREITGSGTSGQYVPSPDHPIVLSDGEEGTAAESDGSDDDVVEVTDVNPGARTSLLSLGAGPGPSSTFIAGASPAHNRSTRRTKRQTLADVTIIHDEDEGDESAAAALTRAAPRTRHPATAPRDVTAAGEVYTLDTCNCSVALQFLAAQLQPALTAATTYVSTFPGGAAAAGAVAATKAAAAAVSPSSSASLMDLAAPLFCPSPGCGRWLSSRDVRLLLGPYGTQVLYYAVHATMWREGKAAKVAAARCDPVANGAGGPAARRGCYAAGPGQQAALATHSAAAPAGVAPLDLTASLPPLAPSCPSCRVRMLSAGQLSQVQGGQLQPPPQQQQQQQQQQQRRGQRARRQAAQGPAATDAVAAAVAAGHGRRYTGPMLGDCSGAAAAGHPSAATAAAAAARAVQLRAALAARDRPPPPPNVSLEQLCSALCDAVGPRCVFLCTGCPRVVDQRETLPKARMQELQVMSDRAFRALKLLRRLRAVLLNVREDEQEQEEDEGKAGGKGVGSTAAGGGSHATPAAAGCGDGVWGGSCGGWGKKRRRSYHSSSSLAVNHAWAKGVGYGGEGGESSGGTSCASAASVHAKEAAMKAAQERQRQADEEVRVCLRALLDIIINPSSSTRGGGGGLPGLASPPPVLHAVLQYGGLPYVLRLLFQNDSLLDMGQRQEMYRAALALLRCCLGSMSLLELLSVPATDPWDITAPGGAAAAATAPSAGPVAGALGADPPLSTVVESLGRQCTIFKRTAQELAEEEDIAALGLALELGSLAEEVAGGVGMWRRSMEGAPGTLHALMQIPGGGSGGGADGGAAAAAAANLDDPPAKRGTTSPGLATTTTTTTAGSVSGYGPSPISRAAAAPADGAAAAAAAAAALAARRSEYVGVMQPLQFREVALMADHFFRRDAESSGSGAGGELMRRRLQRVTGELSGLTTGLPMDWEAAAFVAVDDSRLDVIRALLIPSSDTPYANGAFIFDIFLPHEYPCVPPKVQFLTTGGGRVRFNPNLYADGKVCLSLLGTWTGPAWDPKMSTVLQILVSIQSMVLVSDPYYNEPGLEPQANTPAGRQAASHYADTTRYNTLAFSILPALQMVTQPKEGDAAKGCPLAGGSTFRDVLTHHYRFKRGELLKQCDEWMASIATSAGSAAANSKSLIESSQEKLRKCVEQVLPQIKLLLQKL